MLENRSPFHLSASTERCADWQMCQIPTSATLSRDCYFRTQCYYSARITKYQAVIADGRSVAMTQMLTDFLSLSPFVQFIALIALFVIVMVAIHRRDLTENLCNIILAIRGITPPPRQEDKEIPEK